MTNTEFEKLDNLLAQLVDNSRKARRATQLFDEALLAHDVVEFNRRRNELIAVYEHRHALMSATVAL